MGILWRMDCSKSAASQRSSLAESQKYFPFRAVSFRQKAAQGFDFLCFAKRTCLEQSAMRLIFFHISNGSKMQPALVQSESWDTGRNKTAYTTHQSHLPPSKHIKAPPILNTCVASVTMFLPFCHQRKSLTFGKIYLLSCRGFDYKINTSLLLSVKFTTRDV